MSPVKTCDAAKSTDCWWPTHAAPFWLDIGDFMVYSALRDALDDTRAPVVVACINVLLQRVDRWRIDWREKLSQVQS